MIVDSATGVTLTGAAAFGARDLARALRLAPCLVAADGGADRLLRLGATPQAVIGDLDSLSAEARARLAGRLHEIPEQDSTDFDKALGRIRAPFILGLGFSGGRADHALAAISGLARHPLQRCFLVSAQDVSFLAPPALTLHLPQGSPLSLFPLGPVRGTSQGLRWPIAGLDFAPDGQIGTSNAVLEGPVRLTFTAAKMLVIVPLRSLAAVLRGFALLPARAR